MKLSNFETETWMTLHENNCQYNMTDACIQSLTMKELFDICQDDHVEKTIMNMTLDYGPIEGSHELKKGILRLYQTGEDDNIAICHGGVNANELVLMTILNKGDHIISFTPSYQQLYSFPESLGVEYDLVELKEENQWIPTIDEIQSLIRPNTKMICLNLPNNPTGTTLSIDMLNQLINICKDKDIYIFVDEAYRGLYNEVSISDIYEKGIATSGLSKIFSVAGLRIGWIKTMDKSLIKTINERRDYHIICSGPLNDYLASLVLKHADEIIIRNNKIVETNKAYLKKWLNEQEYVSCVIPKYGTVCFLHYHFDMDSKVLSERLQDETGVFFVPGGCFDSKNHLRLGLGIQPSVFIEGLNILSQWIGRHI